MLMKLFVFLIIVLALAAGALTKVPPETIKDIQHIISVRDFFDAALPVLAFGALIKYLCTCCMKCRKCHCKMEDK